MLMVNDRETLVAGAKVASPACEATTVQVPVVTSVSVAPFVPVVVQTPVVEDENDTGSPEVAVADNVLGLSAKVIGLGAAKVIVCAVPALVTVKFCVLAASVLQSRLPELPEALKVQVPGPAGVTVTELVPPVVDVEPTVQMLSVVEVTVPGLRPELVVTLTDVGLVAEMLPPAGFHVTDWVPAVIV
jgi:hypothetical protein